MSVQPCEAAVDVVLLQASKVQVPFLDVSLPVAAQGLKEVCTVEGVYSRFLQRDLSLMRQGVMTWWRLVVVQSTCYKPACRLLVKASWMRLIS
jgi:hypothetical protein